MSGIETAWRPGYPLDLRGEGIRRRDARGPYGDVEYMAGRIVARATGERVVLQDDNVRRRTPDFRIDYTDSRQGIGEVVTVTDEHRAEECSAFRDGGLDLYSDALHWQWWVTAPAWVNRRRLREPLLRILAAMEAADEHPTALGPIDRSAAGPGALELLQLGVTEVAANVMPGDSRGQVRWQPEGIGGDPVVDAEGFVTWLDEFLASSVAGSKVSKLTFRPGDLERHLFVGISWSAPWPVVRLLDQGVDVIPTRAPSLPTGISHLWIWACELPGRALAWWPERGWFDVARHWVTE